MDNGIFNLDTQIQVPYYGSENNWNNIIKAAIDMLIIIKARVTFLLFSIFLNKE